MTQEDCSPASQAHSGLATSNDAHALCGRVQSACAGFVVTGTLAGEGRIVAHEKVLDRERAEQVAREWRQSGLDVEVTSAVEQPS